MVGGASFDYIHIVIQVQQMKQSENFLIAEPESTGFFFSITLQWKCDYYLPFLGQKGSYRLACKHLRLAWREVAQFGK